MEYPKPKLADVREVADVLRCSRSTVWRRVAGGTLPKPIRIGGRTLWDLREIEALIAAKLAERDSEAA